MEKRVVSRSLLARELLMARRANRTLVCSSVPNTMAAVCADGWLQEKGALDCYFGFARAQAPPHHLESGFSWLEAARRITLNSSLLLIVL